MGLKFRLMLAFTTVLLVVMVAATVLYARGARDDVRAELQSTQLVLDQILEPSAGDASDAVRAAAPDLRSLRVARHLRVDYLDGEGRVIGSSRDDSSGAEHAAPQWFAALLSPSKDFPSTRRPIAIDGRTRGEIVLTPDPVNEIAEKWQDAKELAGFSLLLFIAVNAVLYLVVTRAVQPMGRILSILHEIEAGNLHARSPAFSLPEFAQIGARINLMAEALEHGAQQNQRLTLKLMQAQEEERRRMARELHDELGQSLTAIQADAAAILRNDAANRLVRDSADAIASVTQQVLASVRGMLHRLRPEALEEFGLAAALRELIDAWRRRNPNIDCTLHLDGDFRPERDETAVTLYRSVQEALTNVSRHSGATRVDVRLRRIAGSDGERLKLVVRDNGRGAATSQTQRGFGLLGIRERAAALGGTFVIPRNVQPGFGFELELPLGKVIA